MQQYIPAIVEDAGYVSATDLETVEESWLKQHVGKEGHRKLILRRLSARRDKRRLSQAAAGSDNVQPVDASPMPDQGPEPMQMNAKVYQLS